VSQASCHRCELALYWSTLKIFKGGPVQKSCAIAVQSSAGPRGLHSRYFSFLFTHGRVSAQPIGVSQSDQMSTIILILTLSAIIFDISLALQVRAF